MKIFRKRRRGTGRFLSSRPRIGKLLRRSTITLESLETRSMLAADAFVDDSAWIDSAGTIDVSVRSLLASCAAKTAPAASETSDPTATTSFATSFAATADPQNDSGSNPEDSVVQPHVDQFEAQYTLQTEDLGGTPISSIAVGEDFKLAVYVQDVRVPPDELGGGVFSAYTNILYNSGLASIESSQSIVYGDFFNFVRTGDLSTPGQIASAGATTTNGTPPGTDLQFLFSVIVHADAAGTLNFTSSIDTAPGHDTLLFGSDVSTPEADIDFGSAQLQILGNGVLGIGDVTQAEGTNPTVETPMVFTVSLTSAADETVTVEYATNAGSATSPADFEPASGTLTFAAGVTQQTVIVLVEADAVDEDDETFTVTLSNPTGVELGANSTATGTITDDDAAPTVSISSSGATIGEGDAGTTDAVVTVSLSGNATSKTVTVVYATADGDATAGSDYVATSGTLTFAPGTTSQLITVDVLGDVIDENDESFSINLSAPVNATLGASSTSLTIDDDDDPPLVSFSSASALEGDGGTTDMVFTASLSAPSSKQVTVAFSTIDDTATVADGDYVATSGTLTFAPGVTTQLVTVLFNGDTKSEADETFTLQLSDPLNASIGDNGLGTIENDDDPPTVAIDDTPVSSFEGNAGTTDYVFTVNLSNPSGTNVTVEYFTSDLSAEEGSDYTAASGTLTFAPGVTTQLVTVTVNGDTDKEQNESFQVSLANPTNATLGTGTDPGQGNILNDDGPHLSFVEPAVSHDEGNTGTTEFVFAVDIGETDAENVTVEYTTVDGTATAGSDYTATSGTLTFAPGESVQFITVLVNGDSDLETDETFSIQLSNPSNATLDSTTATGTILNDDELLIGISDASLVEGDTGETDEMIFTVILSSESTETVTVEFDTVDGTASAGADYSANSGTLTFAPGATQLFITVPVIGDLSDEDDETFTVRLFNSTNASNAVSEASAVTATGTILDNDDAPTVSLTPGAVNITEGNSGSTTQVFTVTLSEASGKNVTVQYDTADGTALAGSDYTAASGTLTFAPGTTSQLITVSVIGDTIDEDDETFTVNLSSPENATLSAADTSTATIVDDDIAPTLSIGDVSQQEGNSGTSNFVFTVTLSGATSHSVTVNYATTADTAAAGSDFTATSGALTFAPGTTQQVVTVSVIGDTTNEANESFSVNLSNPSNATLADGQGTGTIQNDDAPPTIAITDVTQVEGDSGTTAYVFTVSLSAASEQQVTVGFSTANGTATTPDDYASTSGTLTFAPGTTTQTITVNVVGDLDQEPDETFFVNLASATNATIADAQGTGTIQNGNDTVVDTVSTISGFAFIDGNKDDLHTAGEKPLAGVPVFLISTSGPVVARQTTTAADGSYSFGDLDPGTYNVTFSQPINYKTAEVAVGSFGGTLLAAGTPGFTLTIESPGGISATENNFFVDGLRFEYVSHRLFLASAGDAPPAVLYLALNVSSATETVNAANVTNLSISGTGEPGSGITAFVTDGTNFSTQKTAVVAANGTWSITGIDASSLQDGPLSYQVTATNGAGHTMNAVHSATKDTVSPAIDLSTVTNPVNIGNVSSVTASGTGEPGASVSIVASDGANSTAAQTTTIGAGGTWSVAGISLSALNDGPITFTATATDAAGNTATDTLTTTKDTVAPTVAISSVTDPSNSDNAANTTISGTGTVGATISVVVTDGATTTSAQTTTVGSGGTWTISGLDVSSLADGTLTYTATASDSAGNSSTATRTAEKDTNAPAVAVTVTTDPVNAANVTSTSASGTGEAGASISLVVSDGTNSTSAATTTVAGDGTWSISGIDVSSLQDGTITFSATATDTAGNTATATKTSTKDVVAPALDLTEVSDPINAAGAVSASASGTGEVGASVSVTVTDGSTTTSELTTTVAGDGTWSITDIDVSGLADGTITFTAVASDAAGNTTTDTLTAEKDTTAPAVAITSVTDPVNNSNVTTASASGTGEIGAGISLVASDGANTTSEFTTTVAGDGTWSVIDIDVSGLDDGTITYTVTATDGAGNTATDDETAAKDTLEDPFTLVTDPIGIAEADAVTAGGTGEPGAGITVVATDGTNSTGDLTTTVAGDGTWSIIDIDVSGLDDGTITFDVTMTDAGGNTTTDSQAAEKDTSAPAVALTSVTSPVNIGNATTTTASGTGEVDAAISLTVTDGDNTTTEYTTTVAGDGTWSIIDIDVSGLADGTITYDVTASDDAGNPGTASLDAEKDTVSPEVDILAATNPVNPTNVTSAEASGTGEIGAAISLSVTDGANTTTEYTTTVAGDGAWSITGIDLSGLDDGSITYSATATDDAGNTATDVFAAVKDVVIPTVDLVTVTDPIDASNETAVEASGTGEAGAAIMLTVTDGTNTTTEYSTTVAGDGAWSITGIDVTGLDYGTLTFNVTSTDAGNNESTDSLTADYEDIVAPALELLAATDPVNADNATTTSVSGTGEVGADIALVVTDGANSTSEVHTTVAGDGTWSFADVDVSALNDVTITYMVTATDAANNTSTDQMDAEKDTVAPTVAITAATDPVDNGNVTTAAASGTGEVDAAISLTVTDGNNTTSEYTATVAGDGTWSIIDIDVSGLDDGTITYMVTASDAAGNTATDDQAGDKDTLADPVVNVTNPIGIAQADAVTASGTGEPGADIALTATDGNSTTIEYNTTVAGDGTWSIIDIDVSGLDDAAITFDVTMSDAGGNTTTGSATAEKDTVVPAVALVAVTDPVNAANQTAATASGTGEVAASIALSVTDGGNTTTEYTTTVAANGTWTIIDIDVSGLDDGTITYMVTASDAAGNTTDDSLAAQKDTVAPAFAFTTGTDPIDPGNETDAAASGTGEIDATIVLFVTDGSTNTINYNTVVAGDGTWSITGIDVSGLNDGTITYTATATDATGNATTDTLSATKDSIVDILMATSDGFDDPPASDFAEIEDGFADSVDSALEDELSWL